MNKRQFNRSFRIILFASLESKNPAGVGDVRYQALYRTLCGQLSRPTPPRRAAPDLSYHHPARCHFGTLKKLRIEVRTSRIYDSDFHPRPSASGSSPTGNRSIERLPADRVKKARREPSPSTTGAEETPLKLVPGIPSGPCRTAICARPSPCFMLHGIISQKPFGNQTSSIWTK